jgi:hypothetical protein
MPSTWIISPAPADDVAADTRSVAPSTTSFISSARFAADEHALSSGGSWS